MMRKIVLGVILFTLILVSCGTPGENVSSNAEVTTAAETAAEETTQVEILSDDLEEFDFENYVFNIWSRTATYFHGNLDVEEETGVVLDDAIYRRNRKIEERFNFKFSEVTGTDDASAKTSILAGDYAYDIVNTRIPNAFAWAQEGLLHSVSKLPYIDIEKPYWHQELNSDLTIAGKMFFASGAFNITAYDYTQTLLFNKSIIADTGLDDLYQLILDGKWTFDQFAEYCLAVQQDINGDGVYSDDDLHGYLATARMVMPSFWISGGVQTIYKDNNGIPYFAALEQSFVTVYDKILDCVRDNGAWYKAASPDVQNDPLLVTLFKNGNALFFDNCFYTLKDLRDMEIDFGIIPYPKLDEAQDQYYTRLHWTEICCIPISAGDAELERTSVILEAMACESEITVIPAYYDIALKTKMTRDEESEKMIDILFNTRVLDFGDTIWADVIRDGKFTSMFTTANRNLVSTMESIEKNVQTKIDKLVETFMNLE